MRFDDEREPVRSKVLNCTRCELHSVSRGPVPYRGTFPTRLAIVGEAPGSTEDAKGGPFLGPAGELLGAELKRNGVHPQRLFYCNVVSCYPKLERKTPSNDHIKACLPNCWMQIELSGAEWVVLVGGIALQSLAPWPLWGVNPPKISEFHGIPWVYRGKTWTSIVHPAAALRQEKYLAMFQKDVRHLVEMVKTGPVWGEECYVCSKVVERYSEHGIAFCGSHVPRGELASGLSLNPTQGVRNLPRTTSGRSVEEVLMGGETKSL